MLKRIKNKQKKLGNPANKLIIKLLKRRDNHYDVVLSRRRTKPMSRYTRFGYYSIVRNFRENYSIVSLDFNRIYYYLSLGVSLDSSLVKILVN